MCCNGRFTSPVGQLDFIYTLSEMRHELKHGGGKRLVDEVTWQATLSGQMTLINKSALFSINIE